MDVAEGKIHVTPMGDQYAVTITPLDFSGAVSPKKVGSLSALKELLQASLAHVDDIDDVIDAVSRGNSHTILRVALKHKP